MHTPVRDEPEEMDTLSAFERRHERRVREERPVRDCEIHPHQVLGEHAAGSDRQMPDFRVPHLARWQSNGFARRCERRVRVLAPEPIEVRRVRELDRVAGTGRRAAPAVKDDERYEAARQIATNESTSSDAPPTSAPSTSGCASSSAALSGFTDPP